MKRSYVTRITVVLLLTLLVAILPTGAQGGAYTLGTTVIGELTTAAPLGFYSFVSTPNQEVTLQVLTVTPGMETTITVLNSVGQQVNVSSSGSQVSTAFTTTDASLHTVLIGSTQIGQYVLTSSVIDVAPVVALQPGIDTEISLDPSSLVQLSLVADQEVTMVLSATTSVSIELFQAGEISATYGLSPNSSVIVPLGIGGYEILVEAMDVGVLYVSWVETGIVVSATQEPPEVDNFGACRVTPTQGAVRMRSLPNTDSENQGQLQPNEEAFVVGQFQPTGDFIWWQLANGYWVRSDVVSELGDCTNIGIVDPLLTEESVEATVESTVTNDVVATATVLSVSPTGTDQSPPQAESTQTSSATVVVPPTVTQPSTQVQPTSTSTPSYTPTNTQPVITATFTPSYTPTTQPAPQVAPDDARFNNPLNIPLDSTASVLDFVSYPSGDTEDRVRWDITGMNPNSSLSGGRARLVISVSCFGENTDQVQFFTGGQTYTCGQTIVDQEVTYNSRTGSVIITAIGGEGTYVQWVLTGTATRTN